MIYSTIIITIVPMVILEIVFGVQTKNFQYKRTINSAEVLADNLIQNFTFEIEKAELMADNLADFMPLETYLNTDFPSYREEVDYYNSVIHPMVAGYNNSKGNTRIRVYHNKDIKNYSLELNNGLDAFTEANFPKNPFIKGNSFWAHVDCYPFHPVFSYFRAVQDHTTKYNTLYVASVHLKEKAFLNYISSEPEEDILIILTDQDGNILTSNNQTFTGKTFASLDCEVESINNLANQQKIIISGKKYYTIKRDTDLMSLAVLVSDSSIRREFVSKVSLFIVIGFILFVVSAFVTSYNSERITEGMRRLMNKMNDVSRSRIHYLANDYTVEGSHDEIAQLDSSFTRMMRQIDELVNQVEEDERKLKDEIILRQQAELTNLQQQINPHYLFNTMESVRMNLVLKNDYEDAEIIKIFAESFRRYISIKEKDASLFEETSFIEKYIQIQNYRLGNTIRYQLLAKDKVLSYRIPKLLIQPVIENCIIHGFREKTSGNEIILEISKSDHTIMVTVSDNGSGISDEKLKDLLNYIHSQSEETSVGLQNVYKRLQLYYGEQADLKIRSTEGKGTTVLITIPIEE